MFLRFVGSIRHAWRKHWLRISVLCVGLSGVVAGVVNLTTPAEMADWRGLGPAYMLNLAISVSGPAGGELLNITVRGRLAVFQDKTEPGTKTALSLQNSVIRVSGESRASDSTSEADEGISASLREGWLAFFDERGGLSGIRTRGGYRLTREIMMAVAGALQFVDVGGKREWEVEEMDNVGHYLVKYQWRQPRILEKTKLRYTSWNSTLVKYAAPKSGEEVTLSADGVVEKIVLREETRTEGFGPVPAFVSSTRLEMVSADTVVPSAPQLATWREMEDQPLITPGRTGEGADASSLDSAKIGGRSFSELLSELLAISRLPQRGKESRERFGRTYVALTARLRLFPADLQKAKAQILSAPDVARTLIPILRDAGTPEAQRVLRELLQEGKDLDKLSRGLLVQSLSLVKKPTAETVEELRRLQSDPSAVTQATYGLGSNAYHLRQSDPVLAQTAVDTLLSQLSSAKTEGQQTVLLTALGAAGDPAGLPFANTYMANKSDAVRAAAAQSVRRIPGDEADKILAQLSSDDSDSVRLKTLDAISERAPSPLLGRVISTIALSDTSIAARATAVRIAGEWLSSMPELKTMLEQAASAPGQDGNVVKIAQNALKRGSSM